MHDQSMPEAPTAVITGGSRGIGRAICLSLVRNGYQVLFTYISRPADAEKTVELAAAAGGIALPFAVDVGNPGAVEAFFNTEVKDRVNLQVLVNNAGITRDGLLLRMKEEAFEKVLDVNLTGAFVCMREAAKIMSKKRYGRIINITSVVGQMGNAGQANYSASKAGLIGLTKSCARELASRNVTVNAVAPGFIETDMTKALDEKTQAAYVESIPLKRLGTVEDIANAVSFLASDAASYITGQVLAVNGGMYM